MSRPLLGFEHRFQQWARQHGVIWAEERVAFGPGDAWTTAYRLTPARGARRSVVALHGAGNDALFGWVGLFKRLLLEDAEVFSVELPGHGRTGTTTFTPEAARKVIQAAVRRCRAGAGGRPLHAVGVSLGGSWLLDALPCIESELASAALLVAPLEIDLSPRTLLGELRPANAGLLWSERSDYGVTGLIPSFGPLKRATYPLRLEQRGRGPFGYVRILNEQLADAELLQRASATSLPVLLIYGARDRVVAPAQGERLAAALPAARLRILPKGTHLSTPMLPESTDIVARWIEDHG